MGHETPAHRYDGCVIDDEDMLDGHGGDLCNEYSSQGVGNGRVDPYQVELHVHTPYPIDDHPEILLEFLE